MMSNSIIISRPCVIVAILCCSAVIMSMIGTVKSANYREMEIIDDLPVKANFEKYLSSLEKLVYFVNSHRLYVDVNLHFGIFLVNVNLRNTLQIRGHRLPVHKRVRLERLVKTNEDIIKYFRKMVIKYMSTLDTFDSTVGMVNLFMNESSWPNHLKLFNIDLLNKTKFYWRKELEGLFFKWQTYKTNVYGAETPMSPSPSESDTCLALLAQNPINQKKNVVHCQVPYICTKLVQNGSSFGYGMTHRVLYLLLCRYSRGCVLSSIAEDQEYLDNMCTSLYNEAEFIAHHDFELPDLFMEQICLCSLEGHAQFMRRSWLDEAIDYQSVIGCFNLTRPSDKDTSKKIPFENISWQFMIENQMIMDNMCNTHTTAVAAGVLAAALRYILENYY